jgi:hypothetical protein
VRCGLCSAIFNATEHLQDDEPSPQLTLPIAHPENDRTETTQEIEVISDVANTVEPQASRAIVGSDELETLFQQIAADESAQTEHPKPERKARQWPWVIGALLMLLVWIAQIAFYLRVDIAAQLPGLKPALISYCDLLKCTVPLPQKVELMNIESSDLEADPAQPSVVNLSATLHNRAEYAQAYPNIELSLTDIQDKILARRVFYPAEYLKAGEEEKLGLATNRETSIKLHLDTADLKPVGYKLFLFYNRQ